MERVVCKSHIVLPLSLVLVWWSLIDEDEHRRIEMFEDLKHLVVGSKDVPRSLKAAQSAIRLQE